MELNSHPNSISPNEWKNHETSERESSKTISAENEIVLLTDEEMNSLASKILKAEILGNTVSILFVFHIHFFSFSFVHNYISIIE